MIIEHPRHADGRMNQASALLAGAILRADTTPDAPAVVTAESAMTWAELMDCAGSVDLAALSPGVIVVDCGRRPEAVAAIVACMAAQRPFLLLDDSVPPARQAAMSAGCSAVASLQPDGQGGLTLTSTATSAEEAAGQAGAGPDQSGVLYWIYTSGSTGGPKGAAVTASAIAELLPALAAQVPELASVRCLGVTASFGFDPALQQILAGLYLGAKLALPSEHVRRSPEALRGFWAAHGVEVSDGTPLLLRALVKAQDRVASPLPLPTLLIGGDVLRAKDVRTLWDRFGGDVAVYNFYGVAECAIDSVVGRVTAEQVATFDLLPVGRELRHCEVLLLDEQRRPVPAGSPGEIYIAGAGVGIGYPGLPDQTAQALVKIPGHGVCYRTGDQGHRLDSGELVVTGRLDRQLKVAGRRVEPAEVEAAMVEWISAHGGYSSRTLLPAPQLRRCSRCVLSASYPGSDIDETGLCKYCRMPEEQVASGWGYFRDIGSLKDAFAQAKATRGGDYDALLLFSGGKDSSYVLYRLRELDLRIAAFTFDNGFISDDAFKNIERMCSEQNVPHRYGYPADSGRLLAESLRLDDTVCSGCFVGITATGAAMAAELGCRFVITGLSRGQIIDTKLLQFVRRGRTDLSAIDDELHEHRRLYLQRRSAFSSAVGAKAISAEDGMVEALDFFRYEAPGARGIHEYLASRDPRWRVPQDTGVCSTNCRANDAGIAEHLTRRGYHNYESPLSWEVRLGTLSRQDALARVAKGADGDNVSYVHKKLSSGTEVAVVADGHGRLAAYIEGHLPASQDEIRAGLASQLPDYMIPARIELIPDGLPRLSNNKIDYFALGALAAEPGTPGQAASQPAPSAVAGPAEDDELFAQVRAAWSEVLGQVPASGTQNFFHLGGDSLAATELAMRVSERIGVSVPIITIHEAPVLAAYVRAVREWVNSAARPTAGVPSALGVRVQEITGSAAPGEAATVFLMPDAAGLAVSLPRLFEAAARNLPIKLLAVGYSAEAWPDKVNLHELADEIARSIADRANGAHVVVAGWSFGAVLADHTASALVRRLSDEAAEVVAHAQTSVECWLLDPPQASKDDALELRDQIKARLAEAFPQLGPQLERRGDWNSILTVIDRASHYRDGPRRVLAAQPDFVRRCLALETNGNGQPDNGRELQHSVISQLRTVLKTLAMLEEENTATPAAQAAGQLTIRRFRPGPGTMVDTTQAPTTDEFIGGVDHWSMIEPERYPPYAERLARLCASL